jgi:hypothetical protein
VEVSPGSYQVTPGRLLGVPDGRHDRETDHRPQTSRAAKKRANPPSTPINLTLTRRKLRPLVSPAQLAVLPLKLLDPLGLSTRRPRPLAIIDLDLPHPQAQRLGGHPELLGDRADRRPLRVVLVPVLEHHPHGTLANLTRIRLDVSHRSILLKGSDLQEIRDGSRTERFIRTLLAGWAYAAIYRSSAERTAALTGWLDWYNTRRPHGSLSHKPPIARLNELNNALGSYT